MFDMTFLKSVGGLRAIVADPAVVIVELVLIGLSVNWIASVLQGTRGTRPLRGVLTVLVVAALVINVLAERSGWERLSLLYEYFLFGLAFIALVAFQPELRRAVIRAGDVRFLRRGTPQSKVVAALVQSARYLSRNRYGGLVAIQRAVDLSSWAEKGTILNAEVSANLLDSIFFPNSPLHDLGVIIAGKKVLAANCQFPLAESDEVDAAVGSRHLAAVGMSYETDALVLVVSEETGTISLADGGRLTRFLSLDDLADELSARLAGQTLQAGGKSGGLPPLSHFWRFARRALVVVPLTLVIWVLANQASQTEIDGVDVELALRPRVLGYVVDLEEPPAGLLKAKFRGSARAIERLRERTTNQPLRVSWELSERDLAGPRERGALELLNNLEEIRTLRVSVEEVQPEKFAFVVDEVANVTMGLKVDTGTVQTAEQQFEPAQVRVLMRARHVNPRTGGLPESQRVLELPLEDRVRRAAPGEVITLEEVPVPDHVGNLPIISKDPRTVRVTLRVGGQRVARQVPHVPVWINISPELLQVYEVERLDPQEWLIEVELEGEKSQVDALRAQDLRAYVAISSELLNPAPELRLEVKIDAPQGVRVTGNKHYVQLRLTRRAERTS
ncbi:MAG TPA: diadenylate cyclase [Phycisphaerae bacterium]|jgi:diadenylate cyclase|nr:diadenylate cyclase [Phycisphaerae bacterium]